MPTITEGRTATHGRAGADARPAATDSPAGLPAHAVGYRALKLWQRALDVAADVHRVTRAFPEDEREGLGGELRRAAAAVPAAVAAGSLASERADHQRALQSAVAAVARVETLAALAERLGLVGTQEVIGVLAGTGDVTRLLRGLTRFLAARGEGGRVVAEFDAAAEGRSRARESRGSVAAPDGPGEAGLASAPPAPATAIATVHEADTPAPIVPDAGAAADGGDLAAAGDAAGSGVPESVGEASGPAAAPVAPVPPPSMRRRTAGARGVRSRE